MHPVKILISLRFRAGWSESSLGAHLQGYFFVVAALIFKWAEHEKSVNTTYSNNASALSDQDIIATKVTIPKTSAGRISKGPDQTADAQLIFAFFVRICDKVLFLKTRPNP